MISEKLKMLRERKGLQQSDVAKLLNIQQGSYSNYERGKRNIDINTLIKIADLYKVSIDYIVGNKSKESTITKIERELNQEQKNKLEDVCKALYPNEYKKIKDAD